MADRLAELEWRADCLTSRADALTQADATAAQYSDLIDMLVQAVKSYKSATRHEKDAEEARLRKAMAALKNAEIARNSPRLAERAKSWRAEAQTALNRRSSNDN